jgi:hypothetical protein
MEQIELKKELNKPKHTISLNKPIKQKHSISLNKPIKQKHSPTGHTYNRICSRSCYLINNLHKWTYCECIKIKQEKNEKI